MSPVSPKIIITEEEINIIRNILLYYFNDDEKIEKFLNLENNNNIKNFVNFFEKNDRSAKILELIFFKKWNKMSEYNKAKIFEDRKEELKRKNFKISEWYKDTIINIVNDNIKYNINEFKNMNESDNFYLLVKKLHRILQQNINKQLIEEIENIINTYTYNKLYDGKSRKSKSKRKLKKRSKSKRKLKKRSKSKRKLKKVNIINV